MLSSADKVFIEANRILNVDVLARETGRKPKEIEEFIKTLPDLTPQEEKKAESANKFVPYDKKSRTHKKMSSPEHPGITVMTQGASQDTDIVKKSDIKPDHIFRPH
jgi:hypothetical protein